MGLGRALEASSLVALVSMRAVRDVLQRGRVPASGVASIVDKKARRVSARRRVDPGDASPLLRRRRMDCWSCILIWTAIRHVW